MTENSQPKTDSKGIPRVCHLAKSLKFIVYFSLLLQHFCLTLNLLLSAYLQEEFVRIVTCVSPCGSLSLTIVGVSAVVYFFPYSNKFNDNNNVDFNSHSSQAYTKQRKLPSKTARQKHKFLLLFVVRKFSLNAKNSPKEQNSKTIYKSAKKDTKMWEKESSLVSLCGTTNECFPTSGKRERKDCSSAERKNKREPTRKWMRQIAQHTSFSPYVCEYLCMLGGEQESKKKRVWECLKDTDWEREKSGNGSTFSMGVCALSICKKANKSSLLAETKKLPQTTEAPVKIGGSVSHWL